MEIFNNKTEKEFVNSVNSKKKADPFSEETVVTETAEKIPVEGEQVNTEQQTTTTEPLTNSTEAQLALFNTLLEPLKQELTSAKEELTSLQESNKLLQESLVKETSEKETLQTELNTAQQQATILNDLSKLMGRPLENSQQPLTIQGQGSPEMRTFEKYIDTAVTATVDSRQGLVAQKDLRSANRYWRQHRKQISEGVEALLKNAGFLKGSNAITNAPTQISDIPHVAFEHLSNFVRENTYDDLVHPQFFTQGIATGTRPQYNTGIPNYPYMDRPNTIASRQLDPATAIFNDTDPVTERMIMLTIEELGLGKDTNAKPLGLTSFVTAFSLTDLENYVMRNLGYDFNSYRDLRAYSMWFNASTIIYPLANSQLETVSGNLTTADGEVSRQFLINLHAFMKANRIATYMGGYYGYMHNPGSWAQYSGQLSTQERFVSPEQRDMVSRLLQVENDGMGGEVSGFKGIHDGFMHFMTNSYGVGVAGTDTGVTAINIGGTDYDFDSNFAFGSETIAEAVALPVEIRKNEVTDYGRRDAYIWYAHCGYAEMNVNANATTGTERRVLQIRNKRTL